jgi:hypothetical protein
MTDYTKLTDFASKDALPSGNAAKIVKGTEIDDEFEAIETAVGTKADLASPTFTGTPAAPTASAATDSTQLATTAFVQDQKASPEFTGTPTAPTASTGTDTTQVATTAFVQQEITANAYTLPAATSTTLGGVKVSLSGSTLTISTT